MYQRVLLSPRRYNKREFDFSSLREYNDYLEEVEDIGRSTDLDGSC